MPVRPSRTEEDYFARQEFEKLKKHHDEEFKKLKEAEKKKLKELHHMHCPKCGSDMIELEYQHIKIDECPECGGIYFDKGELDEVIEQGSGFLGKLKKIFK